MLRHFGTEVPKCLKDTSAALTQKSKTFRYQRYSAELSLVRTVLGPKCPYTNSSHLQLFQKLNLSHGQLITIKSVVRENSRTVVQVFFVILHESLRKRLCCGWRWWTKRMAAMADDEDGGDGGWRRWTKTVDDVK